MKTVVNQNKKFKKGTYYVGDLCYVFTDKQWDEVCEKTIDNGDCLSGTFKLKSGCEFAMYGTAYGDGEYSDEKGRTYPVDSGSIGCVEKNAKFIHLGKLEEALRIGLGNLIEMDSEFTTGYNDEKQTEIYFGDVVIMTGYDEDEDEDEDYYDEDEDEYAKGGNIELKKLKKEANKFNKNDIRYKQIQKKIYDIEFAKEYALPGSIGSEKIMAKGGGVDNKLFEGLYKKYKDKDYFFTNERIKSAVRNWESFVQKGDENAKKYTKQDIVNYTENIAKQEAFYTYSSLKRAIENNDKQFLKSRIRYDQKFSKDIFELLTGEKLPSSNSEISKFIDSKDFQVKQFAKGGGVDEVITIMIDDYPYYLKKMGDTTHFRMSNSMSGIDIVIPSHIGQHRGEPYYDDIKSWLKGGSNPNGKSYTSSMYAKGGGLKGKSEYVSRRKIKSIVISTNDGDVNLSKEDIYNGLYVKEFTENTLYLSNLSQKNIWEEEIVGQLSDGAWENAIPFNHWKDWSDAKVVVSKEKTGRTFYARKEKYDLVNQLVPIIGGRMIEYGAAGLVGLDLREKNSRYGSNTTNIESIASYIDESFYTIPELNKFLKKYDSFEKLSNAIKEKLKDKSISDYVSERLKIATYTPWIKMYQPVYEAMLEKRYTKDDLIRDLEEIKISMRTRAKHVTKMAKGGGISESEEYHYQKYLEFKDKAEELLNSDEMPSKYETPKKGTRAYDVAKKQMEFSDEAQKHFSMYLKLKKEREKKMVKGGNIPTDLHEKVKKLLGDISVNNHKYKKLVQKNIDDLYDNFDKTKNYEQALRIFYDYQANDRGRTIREDAIDKIIDELEAKLANEKFAKGGGVDENDRVVDFELVKPGDIANYLGEEDFVVVTTGYGSDYNRKLKKYDLDGIIQDMKNNSSSYGMTLTDFNETPFIVVKLSDEKYGIYTYDEAGMLVYEKDNIPGLNPENQLSSTEVDDLYEQVPELDDPYYPKKLITQVGDIAYYQVFANGNEYLLSIDTQGNWDDKWNIVKQNVTPAIPSKSNIKEQGAAGVRIELENGNVTVYHSDSNEILLTLNDVPQGTWKKLWDFLRNDLV